jgi:3-hydroxybutyryl-CoA dehydrogenase
MNEIHSLGVVGAGVMGTGIAEAAAAAGFPVTVVKATPGSVDGARARLERGLAAKVSAGTLAPSSRDALLGRIAWTGERDALAGVDMVVESVVEELGVKQRLFADVAARVPGHVILASNTQALRIADIAGAGLHADRSIGLHFFAPVTAMKLVELAHLPSTRADVVAAAAEFVRELGKTAVPVLDSTGLVVNRLLVPYLISAIAACEQGLAGPEEIDTAMRLGCGHRVGPLALADLVGLDTVLAMAERLHAELGDARYQPPALLRRLVESGHMGQKSGVGLYDYRSEPASANTEIWDLGHAA